MIANQVAGLFASPVPPIPPGSYESIQTLNGTGSSSVITFSSIPGTYKSLQLRWVCRTANGAANDTVFMTFNGDTGANYARHNLQGNGSTVSAGSATSGNNILFDAPPGNTAESNLHSVGVLDFIDYSATTKYKTSRHIFAADRNGSGALLLISGLWMNTAAVTSITLTTNSGAAFMTSSKFALYGVN